ncbi:MAG: radical SAM protein [Selenomonadaceae bacterium]|nr:radical SAM protein [Selenomonadaceae bacterium]
MPERLLSVVSRRALILPLIDDKYILFNGLYGALDVIDRRTAVILRAAQKSNDQPLELEEGMRDRLVRRGYLIDRQTEAEDLKILSRLKLHAVEQMKKYREQGKKLGDCTLYGGEPLLASNIGTVRNICEHCRDMEMKIDAITNGYDLEHYLDLIDEFKFTKLQITLDGVGKMHDRRRPLMGGGSSYERIVENVGRLLERGITVKLRVNVDRQNLDDMGKLIDEFDRRDFVGNPNFMYYFNTVRSGTNPNPADELTDVDVFERLRELTGDEDYSLEHERQYSVCRWLVGSILDKRHYPQYRASYCGAMRGMIIIDPSGDIYACQILVGDERLTIGKIDETSGRFLFNFDLVKWRTRRVHNIEPCRECPYVMQCGGGCAAPAFNRNGTIMRGTCNAFREVFDHVLQVECREAWSKAQAVEMSKSWREVLSKFSDEDRQTLLKTTEPQRTLDTWKKYTTVKELMCRGASGIGEERRH